MILQFLAWVLRRPLVVLVDYDGELSPRIARKRYGIWQATRFIPGVRIVTLKPNGALFGGSYVYSWFPWNAKAQKLFDGEL